MNRVDGRIALISGACGGIGAATCERLLAAGGSVMATDRNASPTEALAAILQAAGTRGVYRSLDVTQARDWQQATDETVSRFGRLDILVNNAGIYLSARIEDLTAEQIESLFAVNLKGVVLGTQHAFRAMKQRPRDLSAASIVNLSSIAGLVGSPTSSVYGMTKGGVRLFTKSTALEAAHLGYNIRCNSVHPSIVDTDMGGLVAQAMMNRGLSPEQTRATMIGGHPIGRLAVANDIANAILFLASDDSSFMTGSEVVVDGGWTAR